MSRFGAQEWEECLVRMVDWANSLSVTPRAAFDRLAKLLKEEHFGVEHCELDNWDDFDNPNEAPSMDYLNMGDTYALTLLLTDDYVNGVKLLITTWGDWYEANERHHHLESGMIGCGYCGHHTPFLYGEDDWHSHICGHCKHCVSG